MTLRAGVAPWQRPPKRSRLAVTGKLVLVALALLMFAQYLAGYLFLWWVRADPREASPFTIARYAYYYGNREDLRRRLTISCGIGFVLVGASALAALFPRPRSLHGSARFSTRAEIVRAGLFSRFGIILSRRGGRLLRLPGQQGVAVIASSKMEVLIRRAFCDCSKIHLVQMADGLSGVMAFRAYAVPARGLLGPWPMLHFVKIGVRNKIAAEYANYEGNALLYVAFHLGPKLNRLRCGLGASEGILVGDFVEDAEPLRDCASGGRAGAAIANLFNKTLRSWHHTGTLDETRSLTELLAGRFPKEIPEHRKSLIRDFGISRELEDLRPLLKQYDSKPVKVGVTHGDLHATNVLVRGSDAILIDFERLCHGLPLLYDAASLEGGLLVEGFVKDKRSVHELVSSIAGLYESPILENSAQYNPLDPSAWFYACVRQIRLHARELECCPGQYEAILAVTLLSKACNPHPFTVIAHQLAGASWFSGESAVSNCSHRRPAAASSLQPSLFLD